MSVHSDSREHTVVPGTGDLQKLMCRVRKWIFQVLFGMCPIEHDQIYFGLSTTFAIIVDSWEKLCRRPACLRLETDLQPYQNWDLFCRQNSIPRILKNMCEKNNAAIIISAIFYPQYSQSLRAPQKPENKLLNPNLMPCTYLVLPPSERRGDLAFPR